MTNLFVFKFIIIIITVNIYIFLLLMEEKQSLQATKTTHAVLLDAAHGLHQGILYF